MFNRIEGNKPIRQRTEVQTTVGQNGEKIQTVSIFLDEKLKTKTISVDKDNDGSFDIVKEETYNNGKITKTSTKEYNTQGKIVDEKTDYKNSKKLDEHKTFEYNEEENSRTVKSWDNNKLDAKIYENFDEKGRVIKREFDRNLDKKIEKYQEITYDDNENSSISETKNERGEITTRVKTYHNEKGNITKQFFDRDLDGEFEERIIQTIK